MLLHALLIQGLQDHVTGAVSSVTGAAHRLVCFVVGVSAKRPLGDLALFGAVEGQPHVLQLIHNVHRFMAHDPGSVLIGQVVAALDGVERMPFGSVLFVVPQRCADTTLGCSCVRARGVHLGEHGDPDSSRGI